MIGFPAGALALLGFHVSLGFRAIGTLDEAGHELGRYWSTMILERRLDETQG